MGMLILRYKYQSGMLFVFCIFYNIRSNQFSKIHKIINQKPYSESECFDVSKFKSPFSDFLPSFPFSSSSLAFLSELSSFLLSLNKSSKLLIVSLVLFATLVQLSSSLQLIGSLSGLLFSPF